MIGDGEDATRPIKVLEFNCRLGDPETQPILMRLRSDLSEIFMHGVNGTLNQAIIDWDPRTALGVVMASANYPSTPRLGDQITGIPAAQPDCVVFHAGTALKDNQLQTSGGRVLCITALADTVVATQRRAYDVVESIHFNGAQYRTDIGWRALEKT
jgi:phosphoribosylamine--glycine ligase